jgi:type II secretory pathway component PulF
VAAPFAYRAVDAAGRRVRGTEAATSPAALAQSLEARGLVVLELEESAADAGPGLSFGFTRKREVLEVTRALSALLPAGMPLSRALSAAGNLATGEVRSALDSIRGEVERGRSLADSLAQHPRFFPPLYVGLVRAGERSGTLDSAFARLSAQLEHDAALRARLLSVSIYPLILCLAGGAAILVLLFLVVPRFAALLQDTGMTLPKSTTALLAFSSALRTYWLTLLVLAIGTVVLGCWSRGTDDGRRAFGRFLLRIPLLRSFRQYELGARFARLVSTLLGGGAPLLVALDDTIDSIGEPLAQDETTRIRDRIREGASLSRTLTESELFPALLPQLVAVGEESGRLGDFLVKAAEILEERTERALQRVVAALEPAMILVFGGIVGFVALSLLQAVYSVNAGAVR